MTNEKRTIDVGELVRWLERRAANYEDLARESSHVASGRASEFKSLAQECRLVSRSIRLGDYDV